MANSIMFLVLLAVVASAHGHRFHPLDALKGYHVPHTGRHTVHDFHHLDANTNGMAKLKYNISKHPDLTFHQITGATHIDCVSGEHVLITFVDKAATEHFISQAGTDAIVMSHHDVRCHPNGESVLIKVATTERLGTDIVIVMGEAISPLTLLEHADIEFVTSIVPVAKRNFAPKSPAASSSHPHRMNPEGFGFPDLPNPIKVVSNVAKKVVKTVVKVVVEVAKVVVPGLGDFETGTDQSPNVWKMPIEPNLFNQAPEKLKMLCRECGIHVMPIVKFKIAVKGFQLELLSIFLEGVAEFNAVPSIDAQALEKEFTQEIAEIQFASILLTVGGIPVEIVPKFNLDGNLVIAITGKANIGVRANFVGTMKAGVKYDGKNGLRSVFESAFIKVPRGVVNIIGQSCSSYTGAEQDTPSVKECDDICARDTSCAGYKFKLGLNKCKTTTSCAQVNDLATGFVTFIKKAEAPPEPVNAVVEVQVRLSLVPTFMLMINRIGGPLVTLSFGVTLTSSYSTETKCISTSVVAGIEAVIGAKIDIEIGPKKLYEKELGMTSVYSKEIPMGGFPDKCFSGVPVPPPREPLPPPGAPGGQQQPQQPPPLAPVCVAGNQTVPSGLPTAPPAGNANSSASPTIPPIAQVSSENAIPIPREVCKTIFPALPLRLDLGDSFVGLCDSEAYRYRMRFKYTGGNNNNAVVSMVIYDGQKTCTVQGLYSIRSASVTGNQLYLSRVLDTDIESDDCDVQVIPNFITLQVTFGGGGILMYFKSNWCARTIMRRGNSIDLLNAGEDLYLEQMMASSMVVLVLQWDKNAVIYSFDSNGATWASGTYGTQVNRLGIDMDGYVKLKTTSGSTHSTLNPSGPKGGKYLVLGDDCTLSVYASLPFVKPLWTLGSAKCAGVSYVPTAPVPHRGGNFLLAGEYLPPSAGIFNNNGVMEHGTDEGNLYGWMKDQLIARKWTTNTKGYGTIVITLQFDGELILYDRSGPVVWKSGTQGKGATVLRMERCGLALYKSFPNKDLVWKAGDMSCPDVPDTPQAPARPPVCFPLPMGQMERGHFLLPGQSMLSKGGQLMHLPSGNVVMYSRDNSNLGTPVPIWETGTSGKCTKVLSLQFDGNLVIYGCQAPTVFWSSDTFSKRPKIMTFEDNCKLGLYQDIKLKGMEKMLNEKTCTVNSKMTENPMPVGPVLRAGELLYRGQAIYSQNAGLVHQLDGNVVFFGMNPTVVLWDTKTSGKCSTTFGLENGNLVLKGCSGNTTLWESKTSFQFGKGINTVINIQDSCFSISGDGFTKSYPEQVSCPTFVPPVYAMPQPEPAPALPPMPTKCGIPTGPGRRQTQPCGPGFRAPGAGVPAGAGPATQAKFTIAGTVANFDKTAFVAALAKDLGVSPSDIIVKNVAAGSVIVSVEITSASASEAAAVSTKISTVAADSNSNVVKFAGPMTVNVAVTAPQPTAAPPIAAPNLPPPAPPAKFTEGPLQSPPPYVRKDPAVEKVDLCAASKKVQETDTALETSSSCSAWLSDENGKDLQTNLMACKEKSCKCLGGKFVKKSDVDSACDNRDENPSCSDAVCIGIEVGCMFNTRLDAYKKAPDCKTDLLAIQKQDPESRVSVCIANSCRTLPGCTDAQYTTMCPSAALALAPLFLLALLVAVVMLFV